MRKSGLSLSSSNHRVEKNFLRVSLNTRELAKTVDTRELARVMFSIREEEVVVIGCYSRIVWCDSHCY